MRLPGPLGWDTGRRLPVNMIAIVLIVAAVLLTAGAGRQAQPTMLRTPADLMSGERSSHYGIKAHIFILGNWGEVGTMTIESSLTRQDRRLEKSLRMSGASNEETARKRQKDYRGEFRLLKAYPLGPDGSVDEAAVAEWQGFESSATGYLKLNKKYRSERIIFFADHAVSILEDGTEKRVEGLYGCILSPLEYMMEHDLEAGQIFETPFLLSGVPRVFRCEVRDLETLSEYRTRAYRVDIWAVESASGVDKAPKDVWRKRGNVRIWFSKDGPYRNEMLRMKIKFRWYLWLYFDLKK